MNFQFGFVYLCPNLGHFCPQDVIEKAKKKELNDLKSDVDTLEQKFNQVNTKRLRRVSCSSDVR